MCILESVRTFFKDCPFLKEAPLGIEYLGARPCGYTIDAVPSAAVMANYLDGSSLRQFVFVFASRELFGTQEDNLENAAFYERLTDWIEEQNRAQNLPVLPIGKDALSLAATSGGYVQQTGAREARYQIQCRLNYYQGVKDDVKK